MKGTVDFPIFEIDSDEEECLGPSTGLEEEVCTDPIFGAECAKTCPVHGFGIGVSKELEDTRPELEEAEVKLEDSRLKLQDAKLEQEYAELEQEYAELELEGAPPELRDAHSELEDTDSELDDAQSESEDTEPETSPSNPICIEIPKCVIATPISLYEPFEPPHPLVSENEALRRLSPTLSKQPGEESFRELQLSNFAVYCDQSRYKYEMRALDKIETSLQRKLSCYFNGTLSDGTQSLYVRGVSIARLPIGNYGLDSEGETRDCIWIKSARNLGTDIYYKLREPAEEYKRFYEPFIWVAYLAKHVVDFLAAMHAEERRITIHDFRLYFSQWLQDMYLQSREMHHVHLWMKQYPRLDYRTAVTANIDFIYKEAFGVLGYDSTHFHQIWDQIHYMDMYTLYREPVQDERTVVTSYIFDCFNHLPFGKLLQVVDFEVTAKELRDKLLAQHTSIPPTTQWQYGNPQGTIKPGNLQGTIKSGNPQGTIKPGDTISTNRDAPETGTKWAVQDADRNDEHVERWFALVQSVSIDEDGHRVFEVIWYYRPSDTLCGLMKYPWPNELFLSNHCTCSEESSNIREDEVLKVHEVEFGGTPDTVKEFFCRQTYLSDERAWITFTQSHLKCSHTATAVSTRMQETMYTPGDTLLVCLKKNSTICEPCELVKISSRYEGAKKKVVYTLRQLLRRRQVDPNATDARANEVVYTANATATATATATANLITATSKQVVARCQVRWFHETEQIPTPYDREGVAAFFYITHEMISGDPRGEIFLPLAEAPPSLHQGYDPRCGVPKLRGLDLFCGGGNFGRGLEEGGSVQMRWANDLDNKALHTYMANTVDLEQVSPFLGSIDDFQRLAIQGKWASNVPRIGHVDFISGGSPCPGFSLLTNDKTTKAQRKNQSLVASFASCVDVYRPKYGILENVVGIIQKHDKRSEDVFSQLMCALVGMGYQARLFYLGAASCGSAQNRPRVFIVFAASGWVLPETPLQTHSCAPSIQSQKLGRLQTGEAMAEREEAESTPFRYRTAAQSCKGLPKLYDAKPDICVPFPDHRLVSHTNTRVMRNRIRLIPKFPYGMNFSQAWYGYQGSKIRAAGRGVLTRAERELFPSDRNEEDDGIDYDDCIKAKSKKVNKTSSTGLSSNAYGRQKPNQPFGTVVTAACPGDAKQGRMLHWDESRCMTIMEAKRAQGFLDEEVLLGSSVTQRKIIGNSVAREVALALGWVVASAVMKTYQDNGGVCVGVGGGSGGSVRETDRDLSVATTSMEEASKSAFWDMTWIKDQESKAVTPATSVPVSPGRSSSPLRDTTNKRRRIL